MVYIQQNTAVWPDVLLILLDLSLQMWWSLFFNANIIQSLFIKISLSDANYKCVCHFFNGANNLGFTIKQILQEKYENY